MVVGVNVVCWYCSSLVILCCGLICLVLLVAR